MSGWRMMFLQAVMRPTDTPSALRRQDGAERLDRAAAAGWVKAKSAGTESADRMRLVLPMKACLKP
jgi:hypothetical protein